jgi:hypothetical protein
MRSLDDVRLEWMDQRREESDKLQVKVREAQEEKDALLKRAGINLYDSLSLEDFGKIFDRDDYRRRVREAVFEVLDSKLRKDIMRAVDRYEYELCEHCQYIGMFDETFAARLRHERCRPPRLSSNRLVRSLAPLVIILCLVYWFRGALDALVVGVGFLLPVVAWFVVWYMVNYIAELYQHDVTLREGIKLVDEEATRSKKEAARRLALPEIFSSLEIRTGEMDRQTEAAS